MKNNKERNPRLGCVGGQAVMEGVMMKSKTDIAIAVRRMTDGKIVVRSSKPKSLRDKAKFFRLPFIRGIVNFIETLIMSMSTLTSSAEMTGLDDEEPTKFEKWLEKHFGKSLIAFVSLIGTVLGVALALLLFMWLPMKLTGLINDHLFTLNDIGFSLIEGLIKIVIFVSYMYIVSLMKDIKRVFMYHGAEHKSIFCYEAGEELTVENVKKQKRFHPRCGTSFIFVILIISILVGALIPHTSKLLRICLKLLLLPVIVGIGFEFIMYAGKHDNIITKIFSAPGLWMQRITTKEPDDSMMEVAIVSIKSALRNEFPDFEIPRETKEEAAEETEEKKEEQNEDK